MIDCVEGFCGKNIWSPNSAVPQRLRNIYNYWRYKGFTPIVLNRVLTLLSITFIGILMFILTLCIDYSLLIHATNSSEIINLSALIHPPRVDYEYRIWFLVFFSVFIIFWIIKLIDTVKDIIHMRNIREYLDWLDIDEENIQNLTWDDVLDKIVENQRSSLTSDEPLTHLQVVNLIMYEDNYLLAMIDKQLLNVSLSNCKESRNKLRCLTKVVLWSLRMTIFKFIFNNPGGMIRDEFSPQNKRNTEVLDKLANKLSIRFRIFAIVFLILSPFILTWLLIYFIFKYGEQLKNDPGASLGVKSWSVNSRLIFRGYNELPHILHERLSQAYTECESYISCFRYRILDLLAKFTSFILGSLVIVFILVGIYDEQLLLNINILGKSILVWLSVLVPLLAGIRKSIQSENFTYDPNKYLAKLVSYTHYCPEYWTKEIYRNGNKLEDVLRGTETEVYEEVKGYFPYKIKMWLDEAISLITVPILFLFVLPSQSKAIIKFFSDHTTEIGSYRCCITGKFELNIPQLRDGDNILLSEGDRDSENILLNRYSTDYYKMELSIANFAINYPKWVNANQQMKVYIDRLTELYKKYYKNNSDTVNPDISTVKYKIMESYIYELPFTSRLYD